MKFLFYTLVTISLSSALRAAPIAAPVPTDSRLEVNLFAAEPDIVTPIGIAVDRAHRLFVIESHTHMPKPDYSGLPHDRIKIFEDTNGDGKADRISVFADELQQAMNLVFSPAGELYVVQRHSVLLLHDRDGDGVSESRSRILELETAATYPHNGLGGVAFSPDGWLYLGLGENYSADYALKGTDGSEFRGGNGAGMIFRCRPDGSQVQAVARGFWNPFALEFDRAGNLFCADNDDGSLPPCRLVHIVMHGDYGYQRRFGGQHPFVAWDGELPGTLPMMSGVGESPCAVLDTDKAALPAGYQGALLVTSWGDHAIELYRPQPRGASFQATREILISGKPASTGHIVGESFCPVGMAAGPDGVIYISDWADRSAYPVHGKGRIWRVKSKADVTVVKPNSTPPPKLHAEAQRMQRLAAANAAEQYEELRTALTGADPFIRSAAFNALAKPVYRQQVRQDLGHPNPGIRIGLLLALRHAQIDEAPASLLKTWLNDPAEPVRFAALKWIAEDQVAVAAEAIEAVLAAGPVTERLFNGYLATAESLSGEKEKSPAAARARTINRILHDDRQPPGLLALAATIAPDPTSDATTDRLIQLAERRELQVRLEVVRTMAESFNPKVVPVLKAIAREARNPAELRAEAILGLAHQAPRDLPELVDLLDDPSPVIQLEMARSLRLLADDDALRASLKPRLRASAKPALVPGAREQVELFVWGADSLADADDRPSLNRPESHAEWTAAALEGEGDPASGRRVFFSPAMTCYKCHKMEGRGREVGPDLTGIGRSVSRAKLVQDILEPSREIAPQYEQHIVETRDGLVYSGAVVHTGLDGTLRMNALLVGAIRLPAKEIFTHQITATSLMPDGFEQVMTVQDFRDLLAYLASGINP